MHIRLLFFLVFLDAQSMSLFLKQMLEQAVSVVTAAVQDHLDLSQFLQPKLEICPDLQNVRIDDDLLLLLLD